MFIDLPVWGFCTKMSNALLAFFRKSINFQKLFSHKIELSCTSFEIPKQIAKSDLIEMLSQTGKKIITIKNSFKLSF